MKNYKSLSKIFFVLVFLFTACNDLDVAPLNVIQDKDLFATEEGIEAYMAALYDRLPVEDFRYSASVGFFHWNVAAPLAINTGEEISRSAAGIVNPARGYWDDAYTAIRYTNYFIQSLPEYADNFSQDRFAELNAEAHFIRAYIYFALVKRYGGVPIIKEAQSYPEQSLEELQVSRNTEEEVYDFISEDLEIAISDLKETSYQEGRPNKYVAAAFKSRVMLFAGSSAKYANVQLDGLVGMPSSRANEFFKASYDAAKMLEGKYSLYNKHSDKYTNYVQLFFDESSPENIFVRYYHYPYVWHGYDALFVPRQMVGPQGYSSGFNPTLDFVELFDGLPRDDNGNIRVKDENDNCIYFDDRMDLFANAEPRLRASVIFPGDVFKNEVIDVRRGVYVGDISDGITYTDDLTENPFVNTSLVKTGINANNPVIDIGGGNTITAAGASGIMNDLAQWIGTISGFHVRKYMNENMETSFVRLRNSDQHWIDMRYAEVLLNRAEAAYELYLEGASDGVDYRGDAYESINAIRERGGANLLASPGELDDIDIIRVERKKELAFENKTWWDLRRWRTADTELNNTVWNILLPFFVVENGKYVFQRRPDERNARYTFNVNWYYEPIPGGEISKNPNLLPNNPGY